MKAAALHRYLGQEINVFSIVFDEDGDPVRLTGGWLLAVEDGALVLSDSKDGPADKSVSLRMVAMVATVMDEPELGVMDGGKVSELRPRSGPGEGPGQD